MKSIKTKLIAAFIAAGLSAPAAFFVYDVTVPSEGVELQVYLDPVSLPTVCVGRMDRKLKLGQTFTLDECMEMLAEDWKKHQDQLDKIVKVPYKSDWQQQALTDFTFNLAYRRVILFQHTVLSAKLLA